MKKEKEFSLAMKEITLYMVIFILSSSTHFAYASGINTTDVKWNIDYNNKKLKIQYTLKKVNKYTKIDKRHPIYLFVSYTLDSEDAALPWKRPLDANVDVNGNGIRNEKRDSIITSIGKHVAYFYWKDEGLSMDEVSHPKFKLHIHAKEMVLVAARKYILGNDGANFEVDGTIELNAFYAMKYPVTIEEYTSYLNEVEKSDTGSWEYQFKYNKKMAGPACGIVRNGSVGWYTYLENPNQKHCPVVYVNWYNAYDYGHWAGLRLLIEAEWEVLARGKDARRYPWGNSPEPSGAICNMFNDSVSYATDVHQYEDVWRKLGLSTPFGAQELTGNVWEWVDTYWYDSGIYDASKSRTSYEDTSNRVMRGGDWGTDIQWQHAAARNNDITSLSRKHSIGFRCAIDY